MNCGASHSISRSLDEEVAIMFVTAEVAFEALIPSAGLE
jgi:hypothetical protein